MTVSEILDKAADLIEPRGAWAQGWYARDASGCEANIHGDEAVCFCVLGALRRAAGPDLDYAGGRSPLSVAFNRFSNSLPAGDAIDVWNDRPSRRKGEVVAKLREAAAKAREQGL